MIIQNDQVFNLYYNWNLIVFDPFSVIQRRKSQISTEEKSEKESSYSESSDTGEREETDDDSITIYIKILVMDKIIPEDQEESQANEKEYQEESEKDQEEFEEDQRQNLIRHLELENVAETQSNIEFEQIGDRSNSIPKRGNNNI